MVPVLPILLGGIMKLYRAVIEWVEAKAELIREEAAGIALGMYARGFKDAREDCNCGCDIYNDLDE